MSGVKSNKIKSNKIRFTEHQKKFMNKNAQKWVQMVYNEEVSQTKEALQDANGYCCLGVGALCYELNNFSNNLFKDWAGYYCSGTLQGSFECVRIWLGLLREDGANVDASDEDNERVLAVMNDQGKPFREIAQVMLDYPEQYFIPVSEQ